MSARFIAAVRHPFGGVGTGTGCPEPNVRGDRQISVNAVKVGLGMLCVVVLGLAGCGQDVPLDLADRGGWVRLPDPPLSGRNDANIVGVGDDVIVFGGTDFLCPPGADCDFGDSVAFGDGAAFDRSLNEWRPIAGLPVPTILADTAVVGDEVFALTRSLGGVHRELVAYDVSDDAWARIDLPDDTAPLGRNSIVATDDAIVLYRTTDENGTAPDWLFDPTEQSWSELPDDPLGAGFGRSMVWNGDALFLFDKALVESPGGADGPSYTRTARYQDGTWTALATADTIGPAPALVDRHRLIAPVLGCADGGENNNYGRCIPFGAAFDTIANEWGDLPNAPGKGRKDISSYGGVSGTDLVAGSTSGPFFDATTDEWFDLPPLDPETDQSSSDIENQTFVTRRAAPVGDAIVVVGGDKFGPDGSALLADAYMWTP